MNADDELAARLADQQAAVRRLEREAQEAAHQAQPAGAGVEARVANLLPGDLVTGPGNERAVVLCVHTPHPLYLGLAMVLWRLEDGRLSPDALDLRQVVGTVVRTGRDDRVARLRQALRGEGLGW